MSYVRRTSRALAGPPGDEALSHPRRGRELGTVADTGPEIHHWEDRLSSRGARARRDSNYLTHADQRYRRNELIHDSRVLINFIHRKNFDSSIHKEKNQKRKTHAVNIEKHAYNNTSCSTVNVQH